MFHVAVFNTSNGNTGLKISLITQLFVNIQSIFLLSCCMAVVDFWAEVCACGLYFDQHIALLSDVRW